jgi:hypothetical protein
MKTKMIVFAGAMGSILLSSGAANAVTFATEPFVRSAHTSAKAYTDSVAATKQNSLPAATGNNGKVLGVTDAAGTLGWINQPTVNTTALENRIGTVETEIKKHGDIVTHNAAEFAPAGAVAGKADAVATGAGTGTKVTVNAQGIVTATSNAAITDITGLQPALDAKANASALTGLAEKTYVDSAIAGLAGANVCTSNQVLTSNGTGGYVCAGVTPDVFVP